MKRVAIPLVLLALVAAWSFGRWSGAASEPPQVRARAVDELNRNAEQRHPQPVVAAARAGNGPGRMEGASAEQAVARPQPETGKHGAESEGAATPITGELDIRQQVDALMRSEVAVLTQPSQLPGYLADLEARALRQGRASALEVEPGFEAIRRFQNELGEDETQRRLVEFSTRMAAIGQRSATGDASLGESVPSASKLRDMLAEIASAPSERRAQLEQVYHVQVGMLPVAERMEALEQLARISPASPPVGNR